MRKKRRASQTSTLTARNECLDVANVQQFRQFLFKFLSWNLIDHLKLTVFALEHKVKQEINIEFYSNKFRTDNGLLRCKHAKHDLSKIVESLWPNTIFLNYPLTCKLHFIPLQSPFLLLVSVISYKNEVSCHRRIAIFSSIIKILRPLQSERQDYWAESGGSRRWQENVPLVY